MYELGKKDEVFGADSLERIATTSNKLAAWPNLKRGFNLICGFDQGLGERMIVCKNMDDVRTLCEAYSAGSALSLSWYQAPDPGFITIIAPPQP